MSKKYDDCQELAAKYQKQSEQLENCEQENAAKSEFLAQASHDLQQPLHALRLFSELLSTTTLDEAQKKLQEKISASAENMMELLNNYLDVSRLDVCGIKYEETEFLLSALTDKLAGEFLLVCRSRKKNFHYRPCHVDIKSDEILLERLLRNLLANALKYAGENVTMDCRSRGDVVQIWIVDDGCGISDGDLPQIFNEFFQSSQPPQNKNQGVGLGLSVVKKIAGRIGAEIKIKTQETKGTAVKILLKRTGLSVR